jgi:hypothetical protein
MTKEKQKKVERSNAPEKNPTPEKDKQILTRKIILKRPNRPIEIGDDPSKNKRSWWDH